MIRISRWILAAGILATATFNGANAAAPADGTRDVVVTPAPLRLADNSTATTTTPGTTETDEDGGGMDDGGGTDDGNGAPPQ